MLGSERQLWVNLRRPGNNTAVPVYLQQRKSFARLLAAGMPGLGT